MEHKPVATLLHLLLALLLLGLPAWYLFQGNGPHVLTLKGECRQGDTPCRLEGDGLEARLVVKEHSLRLSSSRPLVSATARLLHEQGNPPPMPLYSVAHPREWTAASADLLAEFPGEPVTLQLTLVGETTTWTITLTAEHHGN